MDSFLLAVAAAAAALPAAASAGSAAPAAVPAVEDEREVRIPFVNFRNIRSFHSQDDGIVYLQDQRRNWYRAELHGPCFGLRWALRIAVDTRGSTVFDRFSVLIVDGERCPVRSLTRSGKPERRASRRRDG
jgi:hypothetical protein